MDIVYVVRPGDENEELRYSLRSLANFPHGNVYICGYCPRWVDRVIKLERNQEDIPDLMNTNENLKLALNQPALTDDFVFMNDDFFFMRPITEIPVQHQGPLDERIENYKKTVMLQAYSLMTTKRELVRLNVGLPYLSYELHTPMVFNKRKLKELYNMVKESMFAIRPRTLYGNYYKINGAFTHDVKGTEPLHELFLSTDDADFEQPRRPELRRDGASSRSRHSQGDVQEPDRASDYIRRQFPTGCAYEAGIPESVQVPERQNNQHQKRKHSSSAEPEGRDG